jgi:uncharacterized membrane protein YdcZ (DUF606 family)
MITVLLAILRAILWPLVVWCDLGFYLRHTLVRKPNMGMAGDQFKFGKLFAITLVCMAAGVALYLGARTMLPLTRDFLNGNAVVLYLCMFIYSITLCRQRHFAFNEKRWMFSYPAGFFGGMLLVVEYQLVKMTRPEMVTALLISCAVVAVISALFGAFVFKHRPKDMSKVMRKSMI